MSTGDDPASIDELTIVRAPGFETTELELADLSPGVNLIHGPNAAGKTTTADSITNLLWPNAANDGEQLVGHFSLNGDHWRVDVTNGEATYQRNGGDAAAPDLPSRDHQDRYRLSLHELLQQETRNENFAETIARESAGGYDLAAAHEELSYTQSPITRRKGVFQDAQNAVSTWRNERGEAEGLEEERSRLTKLRNELEEAKQARGEKQALEQAITYHKAKSKLEDATATLQGFSDKLERVDGDEFQDVEELDTEIEEWQQEKADAKDKQEDAKAALDEAALPNDGVPEGTIAELKQRRDALKELESRENTLDGELEAAKAERQNARSDIPLDVAHEALVELDPGTWTDVSEFARTAQKVQAEREFQQAATKWAESTDAPEDHLRALERGSKALEEWLITVPEPEVASSGQAAFHIGIASALIVSLAGVALGVLVNPLLFAVILIGLGLFIYGYQHRAEAGDTGDARAPHRESFEQTGLASPSSWTEDAVQTRLIEIYDEIAEHEIIDERQQQHKTLIDEHALDRKEQALAEKRQELKDQLGAAPDSTDIELAVIVRRVLDWQDAHDEVVRLQEERKQVVDNRDQARARLQDELQEYGYDDIEDSANATQAIRNLERRKTNHKNAKQALAEANSTIEKAERKIAAATDQREQIFTTVDLDPTEHDELQSLCEQVDEYKAANREVEKTEAVVDQEREKLEALPAYQPTLLDQELPALNQELREVTDIADSHDEIQEQISKIEAKINDAKSDTAVEDAIAEKDRALGELEAQLTDDYGALVGDVLVDHLQDVTVEANRPAVFQRASELLTTITHGRYKLDFDEGEQLFRAFDTAKQKGFALDELSSGTRVQVLLAVRLAFVEQQEQSARLPIVLDETLANTDDLRAEAIIESLIELAREGRQIFYFTAQGDELAKWQTALEQTADVEWTTIDLAAIRNLDRGVEAPALDSIENLTPTPPAPTDHDHESYGEALDVAPFNPYEGAGTAHLWYVVEDIEVLYELLALGVERWGQLQNLLNRGRDEFVPADPATIESIQQNAAALDEFAQSWCIGRGEPVDRMVLEASGAVSTTFIDRVTEVANELNGDAEDLVEALYAGKVDRFRRNKAEELEDYLRENGYIVPTEPLDEKEIQIRVTDRLVEHDVHRDQAAERANDLLTRITHT